MKSSRKCVKTVTRIRLSETVDMKPLFLEYSHFPAEITWQAEELLAGFQNSATTFEVENIEETSTKYEVEGKYGDMVKLYITEHEVEGGEKSGKQDFIPENEKGC